MGVILDTTLLVAAERKRFDLEAYLEACAGEAIGIAAIVASELLVGVHRATPAHVATRSAFVEQNLARLPVIPFTLAVARTHARLFADLQAAGTAAGNHDLLIAATAVSLGWRVATRDQRSFPRIPGVVVELV